MCTKCRQINERIGKHAINRRFIVDARVFTRVIRFKRELFFPRRTGRAHTPRRRGYIARNETRNPFILALHTVVRARARSDSKIIARVLLPRAREGRRPPPLLRET